MGFQTPWRIVRSLIVTYLISGILLGGLAFALYRFRIPESQVNLGINAVYILSCLAGGFLAGKSIKSRRFFWGLLTGVLYFAFLFLMSLAQNGGLPDDPVRAGSVLVMCAASGMAGGMLS